VFRNFLLFTCFANNATHTAMFTTTVHIASTGCLLETGITGFTGFGGSGASSGSRLGSTPNFEFEKVFKVLILNVFCSQFDLVFCNIFDMFGLS